VGAAESAGSDRLKGIEAARIAFYEGFVAEAFGSFFAEAEVMDSSGTPHRGFLTAQDMANYRARVEEPLCYDYRGLTVCKTGPWGQGPVFAQQLALLSGFDLDDTGPTDVDFVHTVVECAKLAFADREAYYGDPDFVTVPMEVLLSAEYNDARRRLVTETASAELRPRPWPPRPITLPATAMWFAGPGSRPPRRPGAWRVTPAIWTSSIGGGTW
jgi:gamma-glutamyltranspeptidase/glutathione hydrolase